MPQTIAGIDIGTHSLKIALLRITFRGYEFLRLIERPLAAEGPKGDGPEESDEAEGSAPPEQEAHAGGSEEESGRGPDDIGALISRTLAEAEISPDRLITSLPPGQFSCRVVSLPFKQKKKIDQTIAFELESQVPFNMDEMILDYQILETSESGTEVMAILAPKSAIEERLKLFEAAGLEAHIIDVAPMALFNVARETFGAEGGNIALLDIGCAQSNLCILKDGMIRQIRTIPIAGARITAAIAGSLGLSTEEAEKHKIEQGYIEIEQDEIIPEEARRLSDVIKGSLDPLVGELQRSLSAYGSDEEQRGVDRIYLSGGTSRIKNLPHYLSASLDMEVTRLKPSFEVSSVLTHPAREEAILPHAFGLGLRGAREGKGSQINLRRGDFAFRLAGSDLRSQMIRIGVMAAVLLLLLSFKLYRGYHAQSSEYKEISARIEDVFNSTFPELKHIKNDKQRIATMKSKVSEAGSQMSLLGNISPDSLTVLNSLKEISTRIDSATTIDVKELNIDNEKIRMQGETKTFESVDLIKGNLAKCPQFKEVDVTNAKLTVDQARVKFNIKILLQD